MKATGVLFDEPAVPEASGEKVTNALCRKLSDSDYSIDGTDISFPVVVADAAMLMNAFLVDADAAQAMIEDSGFRVARVLPGKAIVQLLAVDYRQNDLGDYNEAAILFPVLTPGESTPFPLFGAMRRMARGKLGNFVYRMPVDQPFTTHAGRFIWGFPKWMSRIEIEFGAAGASGTFYDEDELVFGIRAKTGGKTTPPEQRAASLAVRDGKAYKTYGTNNGEGLTFSLGGRPPEVGHKHPLALELRTLGLPKKPLFTVSMTHTAMTFEGPECVDIGAPFSS